MITWSQSNKPVLRGPLELKEYTAADYADVWDRLGVTQSMGRVASALDNAAAEAVNSILKTAFVYRRSFPTREQARLAVGR